MSDHRWFQIEASSIPAGSYTLNEFGKALTAAPLPVDLKVVGMIRTKDNRIVPGGSRGVALR